VTASAGTDSPGRPLVPDGLSASVADGAGTTGKGRTGSGPRRRPVIGITVSTVAGVPAVAGVGFGGALTGRAGRAMSTGVAVVTVSRWSATSAAGVGPTGAGSTGGATTGTLAVPVAVVGGTTRGMPPGSVTDAMPIAAVPLDAARPPFAPLAAGAWGTCAVPMAGGTRGPGIGPAIPMAGAIGPSGDSGAGRPRAGRPPLSMIGSDRLSGGAPRCLREPLARPLPSPATTRRSIFSASATPNRVRGFLRSNPSSTGFSAPACLVGSGRSVASAVRVASVVARANGERPSTAAYSVAPSDQRSDLAVLTPSRARSGAM
jgi:hypothetical protein